MPETPGAPPPQVGGMAADRRAAFEAEISRIQLKAGRAATERRLIAAGLAAMVAGVAVAFVAFLISLGQADSRDVISLGILGIVGLTVTVAGAAVFLRYAVGRFLRFWLLRLIYEQRDPDGH
jgi:uncharacterized membrane protein